MAVNANPAYVALAVTVLACIFLINTHIKVRSELLAYQGELYHAYKNLTLANTMLAVERSKSKRGDAAASPQQSVLGIPAVKPFNPKEKAIYVITPTYTRKSQLVDLTRVSHSLWLAGMKHNLLWIVVEDSEHKTELVTSFLARCPVNSVHYNAKEERLQNRFKANTQRNIGIEHVISVEPHEDSVVYFADDDNAYDVRLFDELAKVKKVGVWPVAYSGARRVEFPVVKNGKVVGFDAWTPSTRKAFPVDMASFAVNARYFLRQPPVKFEVLAPSSTGEVRFLKSTGITWPELEPMANMCTEVLVWHVKTYARSEGQYDENSKHIRYV